MLAATNGTVHVTSSVRLVSSSHSASLMVLEESMDILVALKQEETRLRRQLKGIQGASFALNGSHATSTEEPVTGGKQVGRKRTMSAAARARISKATKAHWAKFRAEKKKKGKKLSHRLFSG